MEISTKLKRLFLASLSSLVENNGTDVNVTLRFYFMIDEEAK
jgi:hypothetical protein